MDFSLWSRAAVGQLIEQEFGIRLQVRSIGKYLARWGFTPQKPIKILQALMKDANKKVFLILDNKNQGQVTRGCQRTHGDARKLPRPAHKLLPGSPRPICRLKLHRAGSIVLGVDDSAAFDCIDNSDTRD